MDSIKLLHIILVFCLTFKDASATQILVDLIPISNHVHLGNTATFTCSYKIRDLKAISDVKVEWFQWVRERDGRVWEASNHHENPHSLQNHPLVNIAAIGSIPRFPGFYRSHTLTFHDAQPRVAAGYYCQISVEYESGRILRGQSAIGNLVIDGRYCMGAPCVNGGTCSEGPTRHSKYTCTCRIGYKGQNCEIVVKCFPYNTCDNGGTCVQGPTHNSFKCLCPAGFTDHICSTGTLTLPYTGRYCMGAPCVNGGTCSEEPTRHSKYTCTCRIGYKGQDCETVVKCFPYNTCDNGGICIQGLTHNSFKCVCPDGFTDHICSTGPHRFRRNIDFLNHGFPVSISCRDTPCLNKGICSGGGKTLVCTCRPGYVGERCGSGIGDIHVRIKKYPSSNHRAGDPISLVCLVNDRINVPGVNVRWIFTSVTTGRTRAISKKQVYRIRAALKSDIGKYKCVVSTRWSADSAVTWLSSLRTRLKARDNFSSDPGSAVQAKYRRQNNCAVPAAAAGGVIVLITLTLFINLMLMVRRRSKRAQLSKKAQCVDGNVENRNASMSMLGESVAL